MRVLFISRCPPYPLYLGDRLILWHLARLLHKQGVELSLLAFADRPEDNRQMDAYSNYFDRAVLFPDSKRSPITYLKRLLIPPFFPRNGRQSWSPAMWQAVQTEVARFKPDVVHFFGGISVYEFGNAVGNVPKLITPYESYALFLERAIQQARLPQRVILRLRRQITKAYEGMMCRGFGKVVVLTDRPLEVIPNGIDSAAFINKGWAPLPNTLFFYGNYEYPPNVDAAFWLASEILPLVQQKYPKARLLLAGYAPPPRLTNLAGRHVQMLGHVPDITIPLEQTTVFIAPLRVGAGIKNKVLEAAAMGKAMVMTPLSADGIGLEEGKHALFGADASQLAAACVQLLSDPAKRAAMGEANKALIAERFRWEAVVGQYQKLYKELANQKR
jgi:polysaccharide biosynthesis protein PslH